MLTLPNNHTQWQHMQPITINRMFLNASLAKWLYMIVIYISNKWNNNIQYKLIPGELNETHT